MEEGQAGERRRVDSNGAFSQSGDQKTVTTEAFLIKPGAPIFSGCIIHLNGNGVAFMTLSSKGTGHPIREGSFLYGFSQHAFGLGYGGERARIRLCRESAGRLATGEQCGGQQKNG